MGKEITPRIEGLHYSKQFEAAVLGLCTLEASALPRIYGTLKPEHFYLSDNQKVYKTLLSMYELSIPIDIKTVWQRMVSKGHKLAYGDIAAYLALLELHVTNSTHLEYYAHILQQMYKKRRLEDIKAGALTSGSGDTQEELLAMQSELTELLSGEGKEEWQGMDEVIFKLIKHQEKLQKGEETFFTTGIAEIDRLNGGFSPGDLIVLAARPSVGKTAIMGKMALQQAKAGKKVGIISLEMAGIQIGARLAAIEAAMPFSTIYRNHFSGGQHQQFYTAMQGTVELPIRISDKTGVNVPAIRSKAYKLKHLYGLDILYIDYLQLVEGASQNKQYNREQEVAAMSRGLKVLAKDLNIPIVALCQLKRAAAERSYENRFPKMSDLRESGAIEQDADVILILHSDFKADHTVNPLTKESTEREADLLGVKWRNGAPFEIQLEFNPERMEFSELNPAF